jgi:hypothetical protein
MKMTIFSTHIHYFNKHLLVGSIHIVGLVCLLVVLELFATDRLASVLCFLPVLTLFLSLAFKSKSKKSRMSGFGSRTNFHKQYQKKATTNMTTTHAAAVRARYATEWDDRGAAKVIPGPPNKRTK